MFKVKNHRLKFVTFKTRYKINYYATTQCVYCTHLHIVNKTLILIIIINYFIIIFSDAKEINECFRSFMLINWGAKTIVIGAILSVVVQVRVCFLKICTLILKFILLKGVHGFCSFALAYILVLFISCLGGQRLINAVINIFLCYFKVVQNYNYCRV